MRCKFFIFLLTLTMLFAGCSESEDSTKSPVIAGLSDITLYQSESTDIILDDMVSDEDTPDSELAWSSSGLYHVLVQISTDRIVSITAPASWTGIDQVTFHVIDPEGNSDDATINVEVVEENTLIIN